MEFDWDNNHCIICGSANPVGLAAQFTVSEAGAYAAIVVGETWQGFQGMVQGGIITGILDDAMWYAIYGRHEMATVTAEITVRFIHPVRINVECAVTGHVVQFRRRLQSAAAELVQDGQVCAIAQGRFMPKLSVQDSLQ